MVRVVKVVQYLPFEFNPYSVAEAVLSSKKTGSFSTTKATLTLSSGERIVVEGTNLAFTSDGYLKSGIIRGLELQVKVGSSWKKAVEADNLYFNVATAIAAGGDYPIASNFAYNYDAATFPKDSDGLGIQFTGTDNADTIAGSAGSDFIGGGGGSDKLYGRGGNDIFTLDSGNDTIDGGSGSRDYVGAYGSKAIVVDLVADKATGYGTDALVGIEGGLGGNGNDLLKGDGGSNAFLGAGGKDTITGGSGDDVMSGDGGNDKLTGNSGDDQFVFQFGGAANADRITDFNPADDTIVLHKPGFSKLALGTLKAENFELGTKAGDSNDYVIYNKATGKLYYDKDGSGSAAAELIATLDNKPTLTRYDIKILNAGEDFWI